MDNQNDRRALPDTPVGARNKTIERQTSVQGLAVKNPYITIEGNYTKKYVWRTKLKAADRRNGPGGIGQCPLALSAYAAESASMSGYTYLSK